MKNSLSSLLAKIYECLYTTYCAENTQMVKEERHFLMVQHTLLNNPRPMQRVFTSQNQLHYKTQNASKYFNGQNFHLTLIPVIHNFPYTMLRPSLIQAAVQRKLVPGYIYFGTNMLSQNINNPHT